MVLACVLGSLHAAPELFHGQAGLADKMARGLHRKVKTRRIQRTVVGVVKIVQHIDAAAKQHLAVNHAQFSVQAPPALRQQQTERPAHSIHQQARAHATLRCALQRFRDLRASACAIKNVGFKLDVGACRVHGPHQGGKQFGGALQQRYAVAVGQLDMALHMQGWLMQQPMGLYTRNSAISGRWSDMRHQIRPRGTFSPSGVRPRT